MTARHRVRVGRLAVGAALGLVALALVLMMVMGQLGLAAWSTITCPDIGDEVGVLDHGGPWSQSNCDYPTLGREHAVKRDFDPLRPWWSATAVAVLSIATVVGARRIYQAFTRRPRLPKDEDPLPAPR